MTAEDDFDPWDFGARGPASQDVATPQSVQVIDGIVPLDDQFGVDPKKAAPDGVFETIYGGAGSAHSFAVVDAAKVPNLPDLLDRSGLPHVCLYDDMHEVAPWLVQLDPEAAFARHLFTAGRAPWYLWPAEAAIFLRSDDDLGTLRAHLRKYTRVADENGARVFLRFWEPRVLWRYLSGHAPEAAGHVAAFLGGNTLAVPDVAATRMHVFTPRDRGAGGGPKDNWPFLSADLGLIQQQLFLQKLDTELTRRLPPFAEVPAEKRQIVVDAMMQDAMRLGLMEQRSITRFCLTCLILGGSPEGDPRFQSILGSRQHGLDRSRKMLTLALKIAEG